MLRGRNVSLAAIVSLTLVFLVGICNAAPTKVRVYSYLNSQVQKALPDLVKAKLPNIELEFVYPGPLNDFNKVQTDILTGNYDLMVIGGVENIPVKFLAPLDTYIARDEFDLRQFGGWIDHMRVNGKLYDLPLTIDPFIVAVNLELVERAGLARPASNWTWDDFRDMAKAANSFNPERRYGTVLERDTLSTMLYTPGRDTLDADDKLIATAISHLYGMLIEDQTVFFEPGIIGTSRSTLFAQRKAVMQSTTLTAAISQATATSQKLRFPVMNQMGIMPLPRLGEHSSTYSLVWTTAIPATSKHPDEAWQVARLLAGIDVAQLHATLGRFPARRTPENIGQWARATNMSLSVEDLDTLFHLQPVSPNRKHQGYEWEFTEKLRDLSREMAKGEAGKQATIDAAIKIRNELRAMSGAVK